MIKTALSLPIRAAIRWYFERYIDDDCRDDQLTDCDWVTLENIRRFLDTFTETTLALESSTSTLDEVLPAMDYILMEFEKGKERYTGDIHMASRYNSGWQKMAKYYNRTSESSAYAAALVLNPSYKWEYIRQNWEAEWIPDTEKAVEELWKSRYKPTNTAVARRQAPLPLPTSNSFIAWKRTQQQTSSPPIDEYATYCQTPTQFDGCDVRDWWLAPEQQQSYPNLSKMALDLLSIPAMAADPERLFSSAKITITDRRNRLGIEVIEAVECLKSWYKVDEFSLDS